MSVSISGFAPGRRALLRGLGAALIAATVAACTATPPAPVYPDIRFTNENPLPIRALRVDIASDYKPTFAPPNVEHLMPVSPERMARQWALDRLQPLRSGTAVARFTILDAAVTETKLSTKDGIKGAFTDQPSERYEAVLRVRISLDDPSRAYHGEVETAVRHSLTVQEGASLNDREKAWYELTQKLAANFDTAMTSNLRAYLPDALAY